MYGFSAVGFRSNRGKVFAVFALSFLGIIYGIKTADKTASNNSEEKCMRMMEQVSWNARLETPDNHAKMVFAGMATPDCKKMVAAKNS